jgi:hypothetical protein
MGTCDHLMQLGWRTQLRREEFSKTVDYLKTEQRGEAKRENDKSGRYEIQAGRRPKINTPYTS